MSSAYPSTSWYPSDLYPCCDVSRVLLRVKDKVSGVTIVASNKLIRIDGDNIDLVHGEIDEDGKIVGNNTSDGMYFEDIILEDYIETYTYVDIFRSPEDFNNLIIPSYKYSLVEVLRFSNY